MRRFIRSSFSSFSKAWTTTSFFQPKAFSSTKSLKTGAIIGTLAFSCFSYASFNYKDKSSLIASHHPKLLCVLFDAGETGNLLPVLKKLEINGKDFRVLVMGTAETIVKPGMFGNKRITLEDLEINKVDTTTPRTYSLSTEMMKKFQKMNPAVVLVGTASRIQQDVLQQFSSAVTVAFVDNISYDPQQESFETVKKVQEVAKHVLCPSKNTVSLFLNSQKRMELLPTYHVVGKPSLEAWEKEIHAVEPAAVLQTLHFTSDKPIVTFIGGYGPGYEVIDPLFQQCVEDLNKQGIQAILQPHPKVGSSKVKTTEVLRVSSLVVGYNSSVIPDAAILGIPSLFFIPNDSRTSFKHEAIEKRRISKVSSCEELVAHIRKKHKIPNLREEMGIPSNSTEVITQLLTEWMEEPRNEVQKSNECSIRIDP